jgi:GNAT superfamily N-acetyltransferase
MRKINLVQEELKVSLKEEKKPEVSPHPTLRHATLEDIPALLELADRLFDNSPMQMGLDLDKGKAKEKLEAAIIGDKKDFLVLVSYDKDKIVGVLAAYAFSPVFSSDRIACEVFWYLDPEYRKGRRGIQMMEAYEYWAKLVGCKIAQYGWLTSSPKRMPVLYERTGAQLAEHVYYKVL